MATYLPEFGGVYLEDSYILGFLAEGRDLRFRMLFALTRDHPGFTSPLPGEARCFREGSVVVQEPVIVEWVAGKPSLSQDADRTFDLGGLQLFQISPNRFRIHTDWFEVVVETSCLSVEVP